MVRDETGLSFRYGLYPQSDLDATLLRGDQNGRSVPRVGQPGEQRLSRRRCLARAGHRQRLGVARLADSCGAVAIIIVVVEPPAGVVG
jgi:hypothetical protein